MTEETIALRVIAVENYTGPVPRKDELPGLDLSYKNAERPDNHPVRTRVHR